MIDATQKTPSMSGTTEDFEEEETFKKEKENHAMETSSDEDDDDKEDKEGSSEEEETQSISTPTRLQQRRASSGGGGQGQGQKRRASMETNELSGVPTITSKKLKKKKTKSKKKRKSNNTDESNDGEDGNNTPLAAHAKRLRRAKRLCFELAAASATLKELEAKYATKSKDVVYVVAAGSSSSSLNNDDNNNNGGRGGGNEVISRWFERQKEAQIKWRQLTKELVDLETELKKRANEVDVYNGGGNMHALKAEEAALLRYVQFALYRAKPTTNIGELRDDEVCKALEKVVKTHGVRFVLSLSTVSKQFQRCIRSPLVWKSNFNLSTETGISDRNLLEILKEDDAMSLCKNIRLDGCRFLTQRSILKLLKRAGKSIETLSMVNVAGVTDAVMQFIWENCPNIHTLDVRYCENLDANLTLLNPHSHMRVLRLYGCRNLRGRVPLNHFLNLVVTLENFHEEEDNKIEKNSGIRLHELKAKNDGVVVYRRDDETVTEEQRKIAREVEAEHACAIDVERLIFSTRDKVQKWQSNDFVGIAACEHAAAVQHGNPLAVNVLTLMPRCGHVMCDRCELDARRHMVTHARDNGPNSYSYPCPACNIPMPPPGGFSIELLNNTIE